MRAARAPSCKELFQSGSGALGGPALLFDDTPCALAEGAPLVRVFDQLSQRGLERRSIFDLEDGFRFQKRARDVGEILHMRPEQNRLALGRRLDDVMASLVGKAPSDKNIIGFSIE